MATLNSKSTFRVTGRPACGGPSTQAQLTGRRGLAFLSRVALHHLSVDQKQEALASVVQLAVQWRVALQALPVTLTPCQLILRRRSQVAWCALTTLTAFSLACRLQPHVTKESR